MKTPHDIKILLAEDDQNFGPFLQTYLEAKGYSCFLAQNGNDALEAFQTGQYNFCLTDVMMPEKDGFTLAKEIRKSNVSVPILFITAKNLEEDRLRGFQVGGDDYITKPFSMDELTFRIQAIVRRIEATKYHERQTFALGRLTFDYDLQLIITPVQQIKLTPKESDLLRLLCQYQNEIVYRGIALTKVWQENSVYNARSMDVYITKLRKVLRDDPEIDLQNVHGVGFKLMVPRSKRKILNPVIP
ncbi:MAG: response regulator transcription factor [Bacteroidales bacterium]|jgi:DNA-binding response OmpR family regulator|nr:response regulator transcription factor [Bacteroidales bacterium]